LFRSEKGNCAEDEIAAECKFFLQMLQVFAIQIAPDLQMVNFYF